MADTPCAPCNNKKSYLETVKEIEQAIYPDIINKHKECIEKYEDGMLKYDDCLVKHASIVKNELKTYTDRRIAEAWKMTAQSISTETSGMAKLYTWNPSSDTFVESSLGEYSAKYWADRVPFGGGYNGIPFVSTEDGLDIVDPHTVRAVYVRGTDSDGDGGEGVYRYKGTQAEPNIKGFRYKGWEKYTHVSNEVQKSIHKHTPVTEPRITPSVHTKILKETVLLGKKAWYVVSPYYVSELIKGNVADPSLPGNSMNSDWEMWRTGVVRKVTEAGVFKKPELTGAWTNKLEDNMFEGSRIIRATFKRTIEAGAVATFTDIKIDKSGICKIAFLGTPASPQNQDIKVNGVSVGTFDLSSTSIRLKVIEVPCGYGSKTITIENDVSSSFFILGANYSELIDARDARDVDECFVYITNYSYTTARGANDYAFKSRTNGLWAGSYHGGQTQIDEPFAMNGTEKILLNTATGMFLGKDLTVKQKTLITWNTNETLTIDEIRKFGDSEIFDKVVGTGFLQAHTMHFGMTGTSQHLKTLMAKNYVKDMDSGLQHIGKTNDTIQFSEVNGRMVVAEWSEPEVYECLPYGGSTVTRVPVSYNKIYQAHIRNANVSIARFAYSFNRKFM